MSSILCDRCSNIPRAVFEPPRKSEFGANDEKVVLQPPVAIRRAALKGCPFCRIFVERAPLQRLLGETSSSLRKTQSVILWKVAGTASFYFEFGRQKSQLFDFRNVPAPWNEEVASSSSYVGSDIDTIQIWLDECRHKHQKCQGLHRRFKPTRLVQVDAFEDGRSVRVVDSAAISGHCDYIALSHCWGAPEHGPLRTTKATIDRHMAGIPITELSKTFQDTVSVARELGFRYVWIDSLCILQDDAKDWHREAASMAEIYLGATLTVSALSAADGRGGLFRDERENVGTNWYADVDMNGHRIRVFESLPELWHVEYGDQKADDRYLVRRPLRKQIDERFGKGASQHYNPLSGRAWALQERLLSTRIAHFSHNMVLWQCHESQATGQMPWGEPGDEKVRRTFLTTAHADSIGLESLPEMWYQLVEGYSARALTREDDKMNALAGIASEFKLSTPNDTYLAGMWSSHLPLCLLWSTLPRLSEDKKSYIYGHRARNFTAPTWSWASQTGSVSYETFTHSKNEPGKDHTMITRLADITRLWQRVNDLRVAWGQEVDIRLSVLDHSISQQHNDAGAQITGHLRVRGALFTRPLRVAHNWMQLFAEPRSTGYLEIEGFDIYPDVPAEFEGLSEIRVLYVLSGLGLALAVVDKAEKIHRRIGFAIFTQGEVFAPQCEEIKLV